MNTAYLRMNPWAMAFARSFFSAQKPVADLRNTEWSDEEALVDRNLAWPRKRLA
jgi:hypothetical protein